LAEDVKKMIRAKKPELGDAGIRLFYGGREVLDNRTLGNYGYMNDTIIQAMIKGWSDVRCGGWDANRKDSMKEK
jgi:hypothetical protein